MFEVQDSFEGKFFLKKIPLVETFILENAGRIKLTKNV